MIQSSVASAFHRLYNDGFPCFLLESLLFFFLVGGGRGSLRFSDCAIIVTYSVRVVPRCWFHHSSRYLVEDVRVLSRQPLSRGIKEWIINFKQ